MVKIMEHPIRMDDLGVSRYPYFSETSIYSGVTYQNPRMRVGFMSRFNSISKPNFTQETIYLLPVVTVFFFSIPVAWSLLTVTKPP